MNAAPKIAAVKIARIANDVLTENKFITAVAGKSAVRSASKP